MHTHVLDPWFLNVAVWGGVWVTGVGSSWMVVVLVCSKASPPAWLSLLFRPLVFFLLPQVEAAQVHWQIRLPSFGFIDKPGSFKNLPHLRYFVMATENRLRCVLSHNQSRHVCWMSSEKHGAGFPWAARANNSPWKDWGFQLSPQSPGFFVRKDMMDHLSATPFSKCLLYWDSFLQNIWSVLGLVFNSPWNTGRGRFHALIGRSVN